MAENADSPKEIMKGYDGKMPNENSSKESITPFAITDFRGIKRLFGIKDKKRCGRMYILG